MSYYDDTQFKIGLTPTSMASLRDLHIPPPDTVVYSPAATYHVRADFTRVGDGFSSTDWIWDVMSLSRIHNLLSFLDGEESRALYIQTEKKDGLYPNPRVGFGLFYCIMWKPILSGEDGVMIVGSPYAYQTIRIRFVNLVEQAGYL